MIFRFKQFEVDQTGCPMKINTDGVVLGAFADNSSHQRILDIGTGTGVIALMMAQRFPDAMVDAIEIDATAAATAERNFDNSAFNKRLKVSALSFQHYFETNPGIKYDLIVSNPPFYINSLAAGNDKTNLAKHAGQSFFEELIGSINNHLTNNGACWLVLPLQTAVVVKGLAITHNLFVNKIIAIQSFANSDAHRQLMVLGKSETKYPDETFTIYQDIKIYSEAYQNKLKDFFTIF